MSVREEQRRAMKGGQTTQKAKLYLGDVWTSQSEQFLKFPLMTYRRRKLFCIESARHTPCIPVSMLALDFAAGGVVSIHVEDGVSEHSQH